jgi:cytochrome c2
MRVIAGLPGDQAREIEAFLRASNNPPVREVARRAPSRKLSGDQLLQQYGCRGCHKIAGDGGTIGPSLDGLFERRDEAWVRTQIKQPRTNNSKTIMPELGLGDDEVTAIILELHRGK